MRAWLPLLLALLSCEGAKKPFTCSSYDDDGKYDAYECSSYDVDACEVQCRNGTLCDRLCGAGNVSCATGGGAVCAMRALANVSALCAARNYSDVGAAFDERDGGLYGDDDDNLVLSHGCDEHAYCAFCGDEQIFGKLKDHRVSRGEEY